MGLSKDERNLLAYRVLTLGRMRVTHLDNLNEDEVRILEHESNLEFSDMVLQVEDVLEGVEFVKGEFELVGEDRCMLTFVVDVLDESSEEAETIELEYLLERKTFDHTRDDEYFIKVIEEE